MGELSCASGQKTDKEPSSGCRVAAALEYGRAVASTAHGVAQGNGATFQLDRFEWAAPDRLEIVGSFAGIEAPSVPPTLLVGGADGEHRLTATPLDSAVDAEQWAMAFLWQEPPAPFEEAEL